MDNVNVVYFYRLICTKCQKLVPLSVMHARSKCCNALVGKY